MALKWVFQQPGPPAASVLSLARGVMAALCFVPLLVAERRTLALWSRRHWAAAAELALYNALSTGLLNVAVMCTPAIRVSFLCQTAIVLTPLIASAGGQQVGRSTWVACAVALAGVSLLATDGGGGSAAAAAGLCAGVPSFVGDLLALGGAATYSLYVYRVGALSARGLSTDLTQAVKTCFVLLFFAAWVALAAATQPLPPGGPPAGPFSLEPLWPAWHNAAVWAVLLYTSIVPGALADVLQALPDPDPDPDSHSHSHSHSEPRPILAGARAGARERHGGAGAALKRADVDRHLRHGAPGGGARRRGLGRRRAGGGRCGYHRAGWGAAGGGGGGGAGRRPRQHEGDQKPVELFVEAPRGPCRY